MKKNWLQFICCSVSMLIYYTIFKFITGFNECNCIIIFSPSPVEVWRFSVTLLWLYSPPVWFKIHCFLFSMWIHKFSQFCYFFFILLFKSRIHSLYQSSIVSNCKMIKKAKQHKPILLLYKFRYGNI